MVCEYSRVRWLIQMANLLLQAIPWLCATTMGLAAVALETNAVFPTFPERIPDLEVTAGLVLPYAARALLGTGGALASFFLVFFAVTSAYSSELISVSSIFTYDIYQTYINPKATGKNLIFVSHAACIVSGALSPIRRKADIHRSTASSCPLSASVSTTRVLAWVTSMS